VQNCLANDSGIACKTALTEPVADDGDGRVEVFVGHGEQPAQARFYAKQGEVVSGDILAKDLFGAAIDGEVEVVGSEGGDGGKGLHLVSETLEARIRRGAIEPSGRAHVMDKDQRLGLPHREVPQQHGIQQAEQRRVGADAEGEREEPFGRESRTLSERSQGVLQILGEMLKPIPALLIAARFPGLIDAAQRKVGFAAGLFPEPIRAQRHRRSSLPDRNAVRRRDRVRLAGY
jgi:hypothetical protein